MPTSASSALQAAWAPGRRDACRGWGVGGQRAVPLTDPTRFPSLSSTAVSPGGPTHQGGLRWVPRAAESPWSPRGPCTGGETEARATAGPQLATRLRPTELS